MLASAMPRREISTLRGVCCGLAVCGLLATTGCGGSDKSGNTAAPPTTAAENEHPAAKSKSAKSKQTQPLASTGKTLGDIPLDVWFNDPIAESQKQGTVVVAATPSAVTPEAKPAAAMPDEEKPAEAKPAAAGGWADLISGEDIQNETKKIRIRLADGLQSVGKYNAHYKDDIPMDGAVLAALAGIMTTHPDSVPWKDKAKFVRDLAGDVAAKSKGLGQKPFEETQKPFEKLDQVLNGNAPADLEDAAPEIPFSEVAKRGGLMKRMLKADEWIRSNIKTEATLKSESEGIQHEARLVAVLVKICGTPGYESVDEEDYQKFIKDSVAANLDIAKAAKNEDFKAFGDALSRSKKACDECHQGYRFGE